MSRKNNLKTITKGSSLFLAGNFGGAFIQFFSGVIIIRYLTKAEYGQISLVLTFISILSVICMAGLNQSLPQLVSKYKEKDDVEKLKGVLTGAFMIVFLSTLGVSILAYFCSEQIGLFYKKPDIIRVIKIFSFLLPPMTVINILFSIFRGFGDVKPKLIFQDLCIPFVKVISVLVVVGIGLGFSGILYANLTTYYITAILFMGFGWKFLKKYFCRDIQTKMIIWPVLAFSLPLFGAGIANKLMTWASVALLGYLGTTEAVGVYNASHRLSQFISLPLQAMVFLYLPIATALISNGHKGELSSLYTSVTKWTCLISLPVFMIVFVDTPFIVSTLLGEKYLPAVSVIRIMSSGLVFHTLLGPNGMTLVAYGESRCLLYSTSFATVISIIVGLLLIPSLGAKGSAIALCCALIVSNTYLSLQLNNRFHIHPVRKIYMVPAILTVGTLAVLFLGCNWMSPTNLALHVICYFLGFAMAMTIPFITRSIDESDFELIQAVQRKLPKKLEAMFDRLLRKYEKQL